MQGLWIIVAEEGAVDSTGDMRPDDVPAAVMAAGSRRSRSSIVSSCTSSSWIPWRRMRATMSHTIPIGISLHRVMMATLFANETAFFQIMNRYVSCPEALILH